MLDDFALQDRSYKKILRSRPSLADGMAALVEQVATGRDANAWSWLRDVDWLADGAATRDWLSRLFAQSPLTPQVRALWFEVPDMILNDAYTQVCGHDRPTPPLFNPEDEPDEVWDAAPPNGKRRADVDSMVELPGLQRIRRRLIEDGSLTDEGRTEQARPVVYAVQHAYVPLLVLEVLPTIDPDLLFAHHESLAVTTGYAAGDLEKLAAISRAGWSPLRRATRTESAAADPDRFKPDSPYFDANAYVAAGFDVNARDDRGESVLSRCWTSTPKQILPLLLAGADVNEVEGTGEPVWSRFAGHDLQVLRAMLDAGANPGDWNSPTTSAVSWAVWTGGPAENVSLLIDAGASPHYRDEQGRGPLHAAAWRGAGRRAGKKRISGVLDVLLSHGVSINDTDDAGITPLWMSLIEHAKEVLPPSARGWLGGTFVKRPGVSYFNSYHETAILLLERGADPDARCPTSPNRLIPDNATPLMCQRYDAPKLHLELLKRGADPHATCAAGKTALDYARKAAKSKRCDREGAAKVAQALERAMRRPAGSR
ncbi:MAG: hypothetical protein H6811_04860 [Phycisphaeraceae bacterium]|nr:hypothetical protein [Phycisphaeraceae bacterium]